MTDVALRARGASRAAVGVVLAGASCSGLGERAFELLEGEQELVGMELLGLLREHRPAQLAHQVFEPAVASAKRGIFGAKRLEGRLLRLEQRPAGAAQAMRDRPCRGSVP